MQETFVLEKTIDRIRSKIKPQWKWAFFACFITGILTFGYTMTNHFLTYDSLWNLVSDQDMITSGRQFLTYACKISTDYDLPWLNGILAIFYMSLTAILVVEGFGIKSKYLSALAGMILITFPSMTSTFCYTYTIDGYMLGVLLATIAFLIADRKKWGFVGGIFLLGISLGIYQAYVSFTILLCILKLLLYILDGCKIRDIFGKAWRYLVMGIGAYAFYYGSLQLMMKIKNVKLSDYQGVDSIEKFTLADIPAGIVGAYKQFLSFLRETGPLGTTKIMYISVLGLIVLGIGICIWNFVIAKTENKIIRILLILLLLAVTPIGTTLVCVMEPTVYFHLIMRLPWALFFVFVLSMAERMPAVKKELFQKVRNLLAVGICVLSFLMVSQFAIIANVAAFNMEERYEKTYSLCVRLVDRLEQTEGYHHGEKVAFIGGGVDQRKYPYTDFTSAYLTGYFGVEGTLAVNDTDKIITFCTHYLNTSIMYATWDEQMEVIATEEFMKMGTFPDENSIQKIGDIWVVKLNG
ncbi:MAG: glucosyltransferase domain-containing protein [Lachnospiraceae bacterium]|nr:glucosyltransferase domain-containing protein [Lachnospiraceae bacterium]